MVRVHDLGYPECSRIVVLSRRSRALCISAQATRHQSSQNKLFCYHCLNVNSQPQQSKKYSFRDRQLQGIALKRSTGVAISAAVGLLEGCTVNTGSWILVFTSGPATVGPGIVVDADLGASIRTHRDISSGHAPHYNKSFTFYKKVAISCFLICFACSLDQVGAAELREAVENSGGFLMLGESFKSDKFRKCLRHIFSRDVEGNVKMYFDVTIEVGTSRDVKICWALGPLVSFRTMKGSVSEYEIGKGGTTKWKMGTLTNKTYIAFFFQVCDEPKPQSGSVFFVQFITRYHDGNIDIRKRVITGARRWVVNDLPEIAAGFDQEAAASVVARFGNGRLKSHCSENVRSWLDKILIRFASKFGDYVKEDPDSIRLASNFSLFPQLMYYLRRSQFVNVVNSTPDRGSVKFHRHDPTYPFPVLICWPPIPDLLDVRSVTPDTIFLFECSVTPDTILLFDSNCHVWRKLGYDKNPNHEILRKLKEAPEIDAEQLIAERVPLPMFGKCDQHSSQAGFPLAKLNPSIIHTTMYNNSDVIFTDDVS
ncbi:LOW QUALITY PROTEIN: Sec23/Sec24 beta-sandwich [Dillenia turbinata]|uniref:Protein transport protein SEC23 n=1 Tax=Dillenia turbinata TaxID=194707 RepID=A0AAN8VH78_9MAGN